MPTPADVAKRLAASVERVIIGKPEAVRVAVVGLLADGHLPPLDVQLRQPCQEPRPRQGR